MIRSFLVVALLSTAATAVIAQSDVSAQRKELMKAINKEGGGVLNAMARDQAPYDQAKVDAALAKVAELAAKMPSVFPAGGFQGPVESDKYYASQKAFDNLSDIKARSEKLAKDAADAKGKIKDLATLKATWPGIAEQNCNSCHKEYRAQKS